MGLALKIGQMGLETQMSNKDGPLLKDLLKQVLLLCLNLKAIKIMSTILCFKSLK